MATNMRSSSNDPKMMLCLSFKEYYVISGVHINICPDFYHPPFVGKIIVLEGRSRYFSFKTV